MNRWLDTNLIGDVSQASDDLLSGSQAAQAYHMQANIFFWLCSPACDFTCICHLVTDILLQGTSKASCS